VCKIPVRHVCELLKAFDSVLLCNFFRRVVRCAIACGLDATDFIVHAPRHRGLAFLEHAKHLRKKFFDAFLPRRAFDRQSLPEITQQKLDYNTIVDAGGLRGAVDVFKRRRKSRTCPRRKPRLLANWASLEAVRAYVSHSGGRKASEASRCIARYLFHSVRAKLDEACQEGPRGINKKGSVRIRLVFSCHEHLPRD